MAFLLIEEVKLLWEGVEHGRTRHSNVIDIEYDRFLLMWTIKIANELSSNLHF